MTEKIEEKHTSRKALVYVRQSSIHQVLHNEESRRLQYAMADRLRALGWEDVEIIDEDLGRSGSSATKRHGFQRLVAEVCLGKVGAVAAREVSRFARNNHDWHHLIEMCSLVETLLVDHEAVYDPRCSNDRLLLGLKGSLSEYELDLLRQRSLEARRAKAKRGELLITPPVGFTKADGRVDKDPDRRVQRAIALVFEKFFELGTARQTLMWMQEQGLRIPAKRHASSGWETHWKRPGYDSIIRILKQPIYAGAYTYGRSRVVASTQSGKLTKRSKAQPMKDWRVLIPEHHEGYISWEQFERIQQMLNKNVSSFRTGRPGAAKKGAAMLAGLLRCRRCGEKLTVMYSGNNRTVPRYGCRLGFLNCGEKKCISFGGLPVDAAVVREVMRVVTPCAIEAATVAANEHMEKQSALTDAITLELESARYAADRARRQYDRIDPENRLVADELEHRWNTELMRVRDIEKRLEREQAIHAREREVASGDRLGEVAQDLHTVWDSPQTDVRLKKRLIRTVIEEVIADLDDTTNEVVVVIHWKGGVHTELRVPRRRRGQHGAQTSPDVIEAVRVLARVCSDKTIAAFLNRNGIQTSRGNRWLRGSITSLRNKRGIPVHDPQRQANEGWMNLTQAGEYVGVAAATVRRAVACGRLNGLHPLSDGPWVISRGDLDAAQRDGAFASAKTPPASGASGQMFLGIPQTYQGEAL